jgi:hypothetical protein
VTKKIILMSSFLLIIFSILTGCTSVEKLTINNNDFEYIKKGNITKVSINNTRDKGFKFVVTDESSIKDIYDILSIAKPVNEKSLLKPDYVFEFYTQNNSVYKFNYVAGLDKKDLGNFYSDNKTYIVSKRIDNDIISNFWNIRRPKDFKTVYYNSLLAAITNYRKSVNKTDLIGIDLNNDLDIARFILSVEVEDFSDTISKPEYNSAVISDANVNYGVVMDIKTEGYRNDTNSSTGDYKCTITFVNKKDNSQKIYYVTDNYKDSNWNISMVADKAPDGF